MIVLYKIFTVQCGRCKEFLGVDTTGTQTAFSTPEEAEQEAKQAGWMFEDDDCFCQTCQQRRKEIEEKK